MKPRILISFAEIKDAMETDTDDIVPDKSVESFIEYLQIDISQWITDNLKSYLRIEE